MRPGSPFDFIVDIEKNGLTNMGMEQGMISTLEKLDELLQTLI